MEIDHINRCIKEIESDIAHKQRTVERTREELKEKRLLLAKFNTMKNNPNLR